ncbi:MAG: restriction endonuclease subunit S [Dehalococcoidia bacterium]
MSQINNSELQTPNSALPPGWRWVRLGEVLEDALPGFACGKRAGLEGYIQLRMNNISSNGQLNLSSLLRVPATQKQVEKYRLKPGDVIFNNTNSVELVGKTTLFSKENDLFLYSNHLTRLRPVSGVLDSVYLAAWLQLLWYQRVFELTCNRWIGQAAVQRGKLLQFEIPLPPLPEQKRIAAKLQGLMQEVQRARTACEKQLEAAKALPAAYLRQVFESEEVKKWERKMLGDDKFFTIMPSGIDYFDGTKEYLSTNSIQKDKIIHIEARITYTRRPSRANMQPEFNSVWFAKMKNTIKVYAFTKENKIETEKIILSTGFAGILCKDGVLPEYLKQLFLNYLDFNKAKDELASGATQQAVNNESIKSISIPLPSIDEQRRIASDLKERMAEVEKLCTSIEKQLEAVDALPQAILRKAFRGEL